MYELTRIYKNSDGDELRVDSIYMEPKYNIISYIVPKINKIPYKRILKKTILNTTTSREIATIELIGDYDSCETSSGNYTYAVWNDSAGDELVRCGMSNLPEVGDSV